MSTKIPSFFLAGSIPKERVGDVLEAMYLAGAKRLDIRPLVPERKDAPKRIETKRGRPRSANGLTILGKVLAFARTQPLGFTTKQAVDFIKPDRNGAIHGALHSLKARGILKAKKIKGQRLLYSVKESANATQNQG